MKIFNKEIKFNLKSFIIWTAAASLLAFFSMSVFSSVVKESANDFAELTKNFPKEILDAFQITELSFTDPLHFYSVKGYLYVVLIMAIFSSMLGIKLINKEESEKTIEFALTKPISRFSYITEKLMSLIVFVALINTVTSISLYLGFTIGVETSFSIRSFMYYVIASFYISLFFGMLSFLIATAVNRVKNLSGISIGIVMISFIFGILSNISDKFTLLKYLSVFEYFNAQEMLDKGISMFSVTFITILITLFIAASYKIYLKKDIYI